MLPPAPTVSFRLDGKRARITGAERGIGKAIAQAMAEYGAHILLLARNGDKLGEVYDSITGLDGSAEVLSADLADLPLMTEALDESAAFDILVNTASTNRHASFLDASEEDYDTSWG